MSEMSSFCINLYPDDYKLVKDCLEENGFEVQVDAIEKYRRKIEALNQMLQ